MLRIPCCARPEVAAKLIHLPRRLFQSAIKCVVDVAVVQHPIERHEQHCCSEPRCTMACCLASSDRHIAGRTDDKACSSALLPSRRRLVVRRPRAVSTLLGLVPARARGALLARILLLRGRHRQPSRQSNCARTAVSFVSRTRSRSRTGAAALDARGLAAEAAGGQGQSCDAENRPSWAGREVGQPPRVPAGVGRRLLVQRSSVVAGRTATSRQLVGPGPVACAFIR